VHKTSNSQKTKEASLEWAEIELATLNIKDTRRAKRLKKTAANFHANPGQSIPQASGSAAEAKATYRLLSSEKIDVEDVLASHGDALKKRIAESGEKVLLVPQDTTSLNFASRPNTEGLGPIGNKTESKQGFFAHSSLCVGAGGGEIFGLLDVDMWAREEGKAKKQPAGARNRQPIEEKESYRWLESLESADGLFRELEGKFPVVSVADREGDIYEIFALCLEKKALRGGGPTCLCEPSTTASSPELTRRKRDRGPSSMGSTRWFCTPSMCRASTARRRARLSWKCVGGRSKWRHPHTNASTSVWKNL